MSKEQFDKELTQLKQSIDLCIDQKLITPSLVLLYTAIDITSWLRYGDSIKKVGDRFRKWTDTYILPYLKSKCSSSDIYGARCGILHTFSAESILSNKGAAKQILYAWGNSDKTVLSKMIEMAQMDSYVEIKVEELFNASCPLCWITMSHRELVSLIRINFPVCSN